MSWEWSEKFKNLEPVCNREYTEFTEIRKIWYDKLNMQKNNVLRLEMFNAIPRKELSKSV